VWPLPNRDVVPGATQDVSGPAASDLEGVMAERRLLVGSLGFGSSLGSGGWSRVRVSEVESTQPLDLLHRETGHLLANLLVGKTLLLQAVYLPGIPLLG
jgi:hypothetical protein